MSLSPLNRLVDYGRKLVSNSQTRSGTAGWSMLLVGVLVAWGIAGRFWIETPNLKPIGAAAMLAGFLLRDIRWAISVPLLSMAISNLWLGGYPFGVALAVYSSTLIYALLGLWGGRKSANSTCWGLWQALGLAVAGSLQFFLLTNFAVWLWSGWYGPSLAEGLQCFLAAVPFYKWSLLGDLLFFTAPLSCWYLAVRPLLEWYSETEYSESGLVGLCKQVSRPGRKK